MGLFDKAKEMASSAASMAADAAAQALDDAAQAHAEAKEVKAQAKADEKALSKALGKKLMAVSGEDGSSVTLYAGGIEFRSKDADLNPGKRLWSDITSVSIEDAEELQQRVTVTRLLLVGVFAFALKKKKGGTKFITVEGEDFLWPMEVGRKQVKDAQKLVMKARSLMKSA